MSMNEINYRQQDLALSLISCACKHNCLISNTVAPSKYMILHEDQLDSASLLPRPSTLIIHFNNLIDYVFRIYNCIDSDMHSNMKHTQTMNSKR